MIELTRTYIRVGALCAFIVAIAILAAAATTASARPVLSVEAAKTAIRKDAGAPVRIRRCFRAVPLHVLCRVRVVVAYSGDRPSWLPAWTRVGPRGVGWALSRRDL